MIPYKFDRVYTSNIRIFVVCMHPAHRITNAAHQRCFDHYSPLRRRCRGTLAVQPIIKLYYTQTHIHTQDTQRAVCPHSSGALRLYGDSGRPHRRHGNHRITAFMAKETLGHAPRLASASGR